MGKNFKYYIGMWGALVALFNVIVFILPKEIMGESVFGQNFFVAYAFIMLGFIGQLGIAWLSLKGDEKRLFYRWSLLSSSIILLVIMLIWGGICMIVPGITIGICIMVDLIIVILGIIVLLRTQIAVNAVEDIDKTIKTKTFFVKSLTVDVDSLLLRTKDEETGKCIKKLYEAVKYSDPMSDDSLASIESEITLRFAELSRLITDGNTMMVKEKAEEIIILVNERNKKCKFMK